jgi:hypothetical protein
MRISFDSVYWAMGSVVGSGVLNRIKRTEEVRLINERVEMKKGIGEDYGNYQYIGGRIKREPPYVIKGRVIDLLV